MDVEVRVVGDGPLRTTLETQAKQCGIETFCEFLGALPFDQALEHYKWADCLILPSVHSEGWPKVVAEAMCHGLICVAVDHGQVGTMLKDRGILLPSGEVDQFARALKSIAADPTAFQPLAQAASVWSRRYSLEGLRDALAELLERTWGVKLTQRIQFSATSDKQSEPVLSNQ
jgi:glycosyltransferase involved in cell wall biosynthesis